jgi:hypothetical protein
VWLIRSLFLIATLTGSYSFGLTAQEQNPVPNESSNEFFSGTVLALEPSKITISRVLLGKPAENRDFLITPETKVEGKLRTKARVTVGFKSSDNGDIAVRIIVRNAQQKK